MNKITRLFQTSIILCCCLILVFRFSSQQTIEAQTGRAASAPTTQNPPSPQFHAWRRNTTVSVKLYEKSNGQQTSQAEFDAINSSIQGWNGISVSGCSGINISDATRTNTVWPGLSELPAQNEILIVRTTDRPGQWQDVNNGHRNVRWLALYE
jgi:hypothetical protein